LFHYCSDCVDSSFRYQESVCRKELREKENGLDSDPVPKEAEKDAPSQYESTLAI